MLHAQLFRIFVFLYDFDLLVQGKSKKVTILLDVDASQLVTVASQCLGNEVILAFSAKYNIDAAIKTTLKTSKLGIKKSKVSSFYNVKLFFEVEIGWVDWLIKSIL